MKRNQLVNKIFVVSLFFWHFSLSAFAQESDTIQTTQGLCKNCFDTEVVEIQRNDDCVTITLLITADGTCKYDLSHYMVGISCGTVTQASNSRNWPMEYMVTDPKTKVKGLKVDEISRFVKKGQKESFTVTYTVCADSESCITSLLNNKFKVAYKAATCVFYEYVTPGTGTVPVPLSAGIEPYPVSCFGVTDGKVVTTVSGGTPPYSYLWSNGATTSFIDGVPAGNYSVLVYDSAGNEGELNAVVESPSQIKISGQLTPAYCAQSNGAINITVTGGSGNYTYVWAHGPETEDVAGLISGSYSITVTDERGCVAKMPFFITSQSPIKANAISNTLECYEKGVGTITLDVFGGTAPYTYLWSNGATTQNLEGLNAGSYKVTITDAEGCKLERTVSVNQKIFYVSAAVTPADCSNEGGAVVLNPQNGTGPYIAEWSNGLTGMELNNLGSGSYTVLVTDAKGCKINQQVTVSNTGAVSVSANVTSNSCNTQDGTMQVTLTASGGTAPYTYYVNGVLSNSVFETQQEGAYTVEVMDARGCSSSKVIQVTRQIAAFSALATVSGPNCDNPDVASAQITVSNGTAPFVFLWNGVEGGQSKDNLAPGNYEIKVVDANGCEAFVTFIVNALSVPSVKIMAPDKMPECGSVNNIINAQVTNAVSYYWALESGNQSWVITSESINQLVYKAGTGNATVVLVAQSADGCEDLDYIDLSCTTSDNNEPGDGNDDGGDGSDSCLDNCIRLYKNEISNLGNGCVRYELTFITDGSCRFELSHLVIDLAGNYAMNVSNSRNWKMELNSTDPKSGLTGIKIGNISGYGKVSGDKFTVRFELCNVVNFDPANILIAYKAGQCLDVGYEKPSKYSKDKHVSCRAYNHAWSGETYFEFDSSVETSGELTLYNRNGVPVAKLFKGRIIPGVTYKVKYGGGNGDDKIMFYHLHTGVKKVEGKFFRFK